LFLNITGEERTKLFTIIIWIVGNLQKKLLQQWWTQETQKRVTTFFLILYNCLGAFEYGISSGGDAKGVLLTVNEDKNLTIDGDASLNRRATIRTSFVRLIDGERERVRAPTHHPRPTGLKRKRAALKDTTEDLGSVEKVKEANLSREVSMTVLDILCQFMDDFTEQLNEPGSVYMDRIVANVLLMLLGNNQCHSFLKALFGTLRHFIVTFQEPLFKHTTPYCGDITFELLRYCNSPSGEIRSQAAALMYLLIKTNYLAAGNFSRMKLQATIGVNSLEREGIAKASTRFEASLSAVAEFAKTDTEMPPDFSEQLTELTERLFTVLRDSIKISQFAYDPERTADLYYQVSKGYTASPDLRASWLATLSRFHSEVR